MAIGNVELLHECFPKHSRMGRATMKYDNETEEGKKSVVGMERCKAAKKKKNSRRPILTLSKYNNKKHNMVVFYKILLKLKIRYKILQN